MSASAFALALPAASQTTREQEHIDLTFYQSMVNRSNCQKSQRHYLACVASLQYLATALDPELTLKTQTTKNDVLKLKHTRLELNANNLALVRTLPNGRKAVVKTDEDLSPLRDFFIETRRNRDEFRDTFNAAFYHFRVASNDVISELINYLDHTHLRRKSAPEQRELLVGAVNEFILVSQDPHSSYRSIEETNRTFLNAEQVFVGLGIQYVPTRFGATIVQVVNGSGASEAGLLPDDSITSINGVSIRGLPREKISQMIRGPVNGSLELAVLRAGQALSIRAIRREVRTKNVSSAVEHFDGKFVGLIRLESFIATSCQEIKVALQNFNAQKVERVVLDLRGNGGGLLTASQCIGGLFLGKNKPLAYREGQSMNGVFGLVQIIPPSRGTPEQRARIAIEQDIAALIEEAGPENMKLPLYQNFVASLRSEETLKGLARDMELADHGVYAEYTTEDQVYAGPLAVLIDANSASASELLAGAFKALNRAVIVGQTSYGKGSVQRSSTIKGTHQLWQTEGLFYLPSGDTNQTIGVEPHVQAYRGLKPSVVETYAVREKDMFLFPLEPRSIRHLIKEASQMNTLSVAASCIEAADIPKKYSQMHQTQMKDMQLLTAVQSLNCFQ